jgi:hypothetical protein
VSALRVVAVLALYAAIVVSIYAAVRGRVYEATASAVVVAASLVLLGTAVLRTDWWGCVSMSICATLWWRDLEAALRKRRVERSG